MQISQTPALIPLAFAATGSKNTIPETSLIGVTDGAASLPDGFPPLTGTPIGSGGVPPFRADMNGILFAISAWARWQSAGGGVAYSSSFAADSNVGGYPKGAHVMRSDGTGYWLNQTENNATDPDAGGAGWVPALNYGVTAITGLTNANVTLTAPQYAKNIITLAGTLTGNVQIIFPTIVGEWMVVNNTSGAFTVTCKTAAGSGPAVTRGGGVFVWGDATNLYQALDGLSWAQLAAVATAAGLTPDPTNAAQLKASLDYLYALSVETTASDPTYASTSAAHAASPQWVKGLLAISAVSYASTAETLAGTLTTKAVTPAGLHATMIGTTAQSWQDKTGSRATGTTYFNSTDAPIMVFVESSAGSTGVVTVGGLGMEFVQGAGSPRASISVVVPPSVGYSVTNSFSHWYELL